MRIRVGRGVVIGLELVEELEDIGVFLYFRIYPVFSFWRIVWPSPVFQFLSITCPSSAFVSLLGNMISG